MVTGVTVSPEDDVEVRRIVLTNRSGRMRRLDLTTYAELALATHAADRMHPAFNKLFVETEALPDRNALLAFRRAGFEKEPAIWVGQLFTSSPGRQDHFESSRERFIGKGRSLESPAAMSGNLTDHSGQVLDPIFSLRREVSIAPGESTRLAIVMLAADSRDGAIRLMDKYRDIEAVDRVFELAWTHTQLNLRYLRIQNEDARRFQELASHMIYPNAGLRAAQDCMRRNALDQSRLWAFGISGDLPICTVVIGDALDLGPLREILQAHAFWNERGLKCDLVILNSEAAGYDQPLQQQLIKLLQVHSARTGTDRPGGVFLRSATQLSGEDVTLIMSVAHIVLIASRGTLAEQLGSLQETGTYSAAPISLKPAIRDADSSIPIRTLFYFNGLGGFTADGREYVIRLEDNTVLPAHWINVLANPSFGALVDETGQGFAYYGNSQMNRLTPWNNDFLVPDSSAGIYLRDEETGFYWNPTGAPTRESQPYQIYHGQGYTRIEHISHGIEQEFLEFVPMDDDGGKSVRIQQLKIRNRTTRRRWLTATAYNEWVLGRDREETQLHVVTNWDPVTKALMARNAYHSGFSNCIAFAAATPAAASFTADRTGFLGRNRSAARPAALERPSLSGIAGPGLDPCAALQVPIELGPGQEMDVAFLLGQTETIQGARSIIEDYSNIRDINASFTKTRNWWDRFLGTIQVNTPEESANFLLNHWLLYQTLSCRFWARSALYQSGGAYGFRDQLQDVMALVYGKPDLARQHILRAAGRQFLEGDVQHWWHPESGAGIRSRCSDDLLWLPYVTAHYVQVTGDRQILDERVPFLEDRLLEEHERENYSTPSISLADGTLFEHCRRAVEKGFCTGERGLPLIGLCDWNDGFNNVGIEGKGESIWLAWFLIDVLRSFRLMCILRKESVLADLCERRMRDLEAAVDLYGWDGEWYRRAYFDDGSPLGSFSNSECRIDSLAQSWAAIAGTASRKRIETALRSVDKHLVREADKLILLFSPPFQNAEPSPGYIRAYPPGVRENGGQYTHAALWVALSFLRQGNGERAVELLKMLNPIELSQSPDDVDRYKCEPYVLAADVYSLEGHVGRGGWTWYTGSSAWMYRIWIEEVLGFKLRGNVLIMDPTIPASWPGFSLTYVYGNSTYRITVANPEHIGRGISWSELDGEPLQGESIPLKNDGCEHNVKIRMGTCVYRPAKTI